MWRTGGRRVRSGWSGGEAAEPGEGGIGDSAVAAEPRRGLRRAMRSLMRRSRGPTALRFGEAGIGGSVISHSQAGTRPLAKSSTPDQISPAEVLGTTGFGRTLGSNIFGIGESTPEPPYFGDQTRDRLAGHRNEGGVLIPAFVFHIDITRVLYERRGDDLSIAEIRPTLASAGAFNGAHRDEAHCVVIIEEANKPRARRGSGTATLDLLEQAFIHVSILAQGRPNANPVSARQHKIATNSGAHLVG